MKTHVTLKSGNAKIGPMAATMRTQDTCPTTCPLLGKGCYATGRIFAVPAKYGREDYAAVRALADKPMPHGVRFNVSGDFLKDDGTPDLDYIDACNAVADAHPDSLKIAYTHAWRSLSRDMFRFPVNASCETEDEIREAFAAGWQAVTIDGDESATIDGRKIVRCLKEDRDELTCASCKLCGSDKRTRPIVSFTVHGSGKRLAAAAVAAKR